MRDIEEFKQELEKDTEYQSLLKKVRDTELTPLRVEQELNHAKSNILRFTENGNEHMGHLLELCKVMDIQLMRLRNSAYSSVYAQLDNTYLSLYSEMMEAIKAYNRAGNIAFATILSAEVALMIGNTKGWEQYTDEALVENIRKIESDLRNIKSRLPEKVREKL